jgi:hypothetical protein
MSRQELADAVNAYIWREHNIEERLDANDIGKLERGEHRWPGARRREAFRAVLHASTDAQLGFYITRRSSGGVSDDQDPSPHLVLTNVTWLVATGAREVLRLPRQRTSHR